VTPGARGPNKELLDPDARIPGFNISYGELERACKILQGEGWSGFIPFDEAVNSLTGPDLNDSILSDLRTYLSGLGWDGEAPLVTTVKRLIDGGRP